MAKPTNPVKKLKPPVIETDERLRIFKALKKILSKYSPPLVAVSDFESRYELVSKKKAEYQVANLKKYTLERLSFKAIIQVYT
ncbi:MAG: hypothetical protein M3O67_08215 [Bacteroidota bacterium]|nr:hypothetical protein [Bacteroidota bacterium]